MRIFNAAAILAISALAFPALPTAAQDAGTVTVNVAGVSAELSTQLNIDPTKVPPSVSLPVADAAEACGVDAATLKAGASCTATKASPSLADAMRKDTTAGDGMAAPAK
ncbi:MAG TPA: hypothetical protein VGM83_11150 [Devosiaceae bacterium]|jgi:hypothetical protein